MTTETTTKFYVNAFRPEYGDAAVPPDVRGALLIHEASDDRRVANVWLSGEYTQEAIDRWHATARFIAAAPEMALALDATARLWHYDHAAIPGSPCHNLPFSRCETLQCATNRALLRRIEGE